MHEQSEKTFRTLPLVGFCTFLMGCGPPEPVDCGRLDAGALTAADYAAAAALLEGNVAGLVKNARLLELPG